MVSDTCGVACVSRRWVADSTPVVTSLSSCGAGCCSEQAGDVPAGGFKDGKEQHETERRRDRSDGRACGGARCARGRDRPGRNGQIAFKRALGSPSYLVTMRADGSEVRSLPRTKQVSDDEPDWSPDGSRVAFTRCPLAPGPCNVYQLRPDGTGLKRLGPAGDDRGSAVWAPDGRHLAYARGWGGVQNDQIKFSDLYLMTPTGSGAHRLTTVTANAPFSAAVGHPAWSPDGKQLVFEVAHSATATPAHAHALFVVNADGSGLHQITRWGLNAGGRLDWSPDGTRILFRAPAKTDRGNLYTTAPDGSGLKQLTRFPTSLCRRVRFRPTETG